MKTLESAQVYARIALLRRKVLLRQALRRAAAGGVALLAGAVAFGFGTRVVYLALLPRLGDLGATAAVGGGYLFIAVIGAAIALRPSRSDELAMLADMEKTARQKTMDAVQATRLLGARAEAATGRAFLAFGVLRTIYRLFRRK